MDFDTALFISLVRERPTLYLRSHPDHKSRAKKEMAWIEIEDLIKLDVETCKQKWRNLKDSYRKSKASTTATSSQTARKYLNWAWHKHMEFLDMDSKVKSEPSLQAEYIDQSIQGQVLDIEPTEQCLNKQNHNNLNEEIPVKKVFKKKRKRLEYPPQKMVKYVDARNINVEARNTNIEVRNPDARSQSVVEMTCDRVDMDFLGFANTFKRLSSRQQVLVKLEITKILADAELKEIDKAEEANRDPLTE